ncbi:adhesion G-protein coupled receptor G4 isoform X2 [Epinephelus moara]|uniref:adhesion G-protein coupled receptor G4 isoform X2 n=1 Tax=Epinephelus moara TaxID=300413 RepID=UPI00214E3097|nr:adhesion G-protein coupled receptor G4 isoform X2 [Epinephelus moara]
MNSLRSLSLICLCIQLLGSTASASTSLWGKKLPFRSRRCIWQLQPDVVVPALEELSVCMRLRFTHTTAWTGFDYQAPRGTHTELWLGGKGTQLTVWLFGEKHSLDRDLKLHEWHSICFTWSGQARRLRIYINGTSQHEVSVSPVLPQQLAPNGTLTLGVSHYVDKNGEVQQQTGMDLLGDIGLFRIWAREWSAEELTGQNCADGDVVRWDLQQWKHNCPPPEPDNSLYCAWSLYKIKMWTSIVHSTKPGNCSVSLEGVTRNWLESVFPHNFSVHDIHISSPRHSCHVVNNSAALLAQQPQGSRALSNSICDKCFSCSVYVNVSPAANVEVVQTSIASLLSSTFSYDFLNLSADPNSISILPVELFPVGPLPTVSTGAPTSEAGPTQSLSARPANMSTTGDPLDLNETAVGPDTFFRVNLTLSMTGSPTKPEDIIEKWVKEQLQVKKTMTVLNLIIKENVGRHMEQNNGLLLFHGQQKEYYCTFHVQEYNKNSVADSKAFINAALTTKYDNGSIVIQTTDVVIKHILPANCLEETTSTIYGSYIWPEAFPQVDQVMGCKEPNSGRASRLCKLDIETDNTSWADPDMTQCDPLVTISDLDNITVTTGNAAEVVDMIQDLVDVQLGDSAELSSSELDTVVEKLSEVVNISSVKPAVGANIVNIVSDILLSKTDITPVASIVLDLTDRMGNNMDFPEESVSITAPSLALSMINVDPNEFRGLTFGVSALSPVLNPEVFVNQSFASEPLPGTDATISLPAEVHDFFNPGERNKTRVQFQFYGTDDLFQDPHTTNATHSGLMLNSYIVSASINNSTVNNLKDRVVVTFRHKKLKQPGDQVQCMFWDFQKNGGQGSWNSRGCETRSVSANQTSCLCDHLTHFAVLLDVSRTPISEADSQILTVISYLGCGISSIFLGITVLTYLAFEKLRQDYPSKILINLSAALLGLNMLFLLDSWLSSFSNYGLCIATATTLHYFLLASFTWMGLEAVHMYLALVKVFNIYVPSYILKFCIVGWGVPLAIVSLVLAIDKDAYGNSVAEDAAVIQSTDQFCWLQNDVFFYMTVVAFVLLILFCNICVFIVVLVQIRRMRANKQSANSPSYVHDLRAVASLTVLLGLTWSVGFFSFGPGRVVLIYLFTIFNSFQGFFIFLFHCLMKENVRKQWRIHLCCGRFRLSDYSDWSRSVTVGDHFKKNHLANSDSVASDNTSSIRKVSDSSTGSAPKHHQGA